jgi:anti-anti-sigma factor
MLLTPGATLTPPLGHVVLPGEVDLASAPGLRSVVARAIGAGCTTVVLDLEAVTFMDCTGLSSLLASRAEADASGVRLSLRAVPAGVSRLLELTGTAARFSA